MKLDDFSIFKRKRWEYDELLPKFIDLIFSDFTDISKKYEYLGHQIGDHYNNDVIKSKYQTINIKLKIGDEVIVRDFIIPYLNHDNTFYINGNRYHPLWQVIDKPIVTSKKYIRIMSTLNLALINESGTLNLYRGKVSIHEYILHNITFKEYLDNHKIKYKIDKIDKVKENCIPVTIDSENAFHVELPDPIENVFLTKFLYKCSKASNTIPFNGTEKDYYLQMFSENYKKQFKEQEIFFDPLVKKYLGYDKSLHYYIMDAVANPTKYNSYDYSNKRVRFMEWILYPVIMKVREIILKTNKRTTSEMVKSCCSFPHDIIISYLSKCGIMQQVVDANLIQDVSYYTRCTLSGTQGIKMESASIKDRNVSESQFGKICPVDTSDGKNVGITRHLPIGIKLDEMGNFITQKHVKSTSILSPGIFNIPYRPNDDIVRLMMGSNQSKQAIPLINPEVPILQSGFESLIYDYGLIRCKNKGKVVHINDNGDEVLIKCDNGKIEIVDCLNNETIYTKPWGYPRKYKCNVSIGDNIKNNEVIFTTTNNVKDNKVANGVNLLTAIKIDYNYEDAISLSESAMRKLTSKHLYRIELVLTPDQALRPTIFSHAREPDIIPKVGDIISEGSVILQYDNFVKSFESLFQNNSKQIVSDRNYRVEHVEFYPNTKYCKHNAKYEERIKEYHKDKTQKSEALSKYLREQNIPEEVVSHYSYNKKKTLSKDKEFKSGYSILILTLSYKDELQLGDKLSNRHGNKGVISKIIPDSEMPRLPDGRPIEICLNPLGMITRMNIGQLYELEVSRLIKDYGMTELADYSKKQLTEKEVSNLLKSVGTTSKLDLTMKRPNKDIIIPSIAVGYMFMQKLYHQSESKRKERAIGSYSTKSGRPVGGSSKIDGMIGDAQRVGEMEMLNILAYGAENLSKELLTIKSSNKKGLDEYLVSILRGKESEFSLDNIEQSKDLNVYMNALGFI